MYGMVHASVGSCLASGANGPFSPSRILRYSARTVYTGGLRRGTSRLLARFRFDSEMINVRAKYPPCMSFFPKKSVEWASLVAVNIVIVGSFRLNDSIFRRERHSPMLYCLSYKSVRMSVATLSSTIELVNSELHMKAHDLLITLPPGWVCAVPNSFKIPCIDERPEMMRVPPTARTSCFAMLIGGPFFNPLSAWNIT